MAALWPDLDDQAAGNNLGVTLNYLLKALEPWRRAGEPPYLVRLDGQAIELTTGPYLQVDVDEFDDHVTAAGRAQSDGSPSAALEHGLVAIDLYRGDLGADVAEADWLDIERAHFRARFIATATRTAQLLLGRGDTDQAEGVAERILAADTWNEDAYGVLASAALLRGDRSGARQRLAQCHAALAELGATPSDATLQLARRAGLTALPTAGVS
jgi:DNA-binding SARP family transcriptional activator